MSDLDQIKQEIYDVINRRSDVAKDTMVVIQTEIEQMASTDALDGKTNLEYLYGIWKKHSGKPPGHDNKINSWIAYYLGITLKKPEGEFLPARRVFARAGFPDIDSDFDYFHRQQVYDFIIDKYGRDFVGNIGTYSGLKLKNAVRRIGKALDIAGAFHKGPKAFKTDNEQKVNEITKTIPKGQNVKVIDENGKEHKIKSFDDAYKYCVDFKSYIDQYPDIKKYMKNLEGIMSTPSQHASGIVISNVPLQVIAPVRVNKSGASTQFPYEDLEMIGLIKFDILAISTLAVIQNTVRMVKQNYGINIPIKSLPLDDGKTFELYQSGKLTGVFQCENKGMQDTMQQIEVDSFTDIMVAIALYRPGPMGSIPDYCQRKRGLSKIDYFHPSMEKFLKPYLERTYGVLVTQEQLMQVCHSLAGLSISDAYVMIKAVGKKKQYLMDKYRKKFVDGCVVNNVPESVAQGYWENYVTPFSGYGFNSCVDGSMRIQDKKTSIWYSIEDACNMFSKTEASMINDSNKPDITLDSYIDGDVIEDKLLDVYETGEKEVFEIELDNGSIIKCTMDHKFYCSDDREHTIQEILDNDLEILYEEYNNGNIAC